MATQSTRLTDYRLQWSRQLKGSDWSGLAYDERRDVLYAVRNSGFRVRVLSPDGKRIRDIKGEGFEDVEDIVLVGYTKSGAARLVLLEEKRWCFVLCDVDETTKKIIRSKCLILKIGSRTGNRGLEGIAFDPSTQTLYAAKEKRPMRILKVPFKALDIETKAIELGASVGQKGTNKPADVKLVQMRLTDLGYFSSSPTARASKHLTLAIEKFQKDLGFKDPDGRIDPGGRSLRGLAGLGLERTHTPKDVTDRMLGAYRPRDISGIWWAGSSLVVLSHESKSVAHIEEIGAPPDVLSLKKGSSSGLDHDVYQAEGIAFGPDGALYVASEGSPNLLYKFMPAGKSKAPKKTPAPTGLLPKSKGWTDDLGSEVLPFKLPGKTSVYLKDSLAFLVFAMFNFFRSAKRLYDWQDGLDGYTWGGGHWPLERLHGLWRKMSQHQTTWTAVCMRFTEVFKSRPDLWRKAGGGDVHCTIVTTKALLKQTILSAKWHEPFYPYNRSKHKGRRMYDQKWLRKCWAHAMLDPKVAVWTADHWRIDQLKRGTKRALQAGAATIGGVCSFVSINSSRSGWAKNVARQLEKGDKVSAKSTTEEDPPKVLRRTWRLKPGEPRADWCSRVAWQYYGFRKLDVRSRMRAGWTLYFEASYGPISRDDEAYSTWKKDPKWLAAMEPIDLEAALKEASTSLLN